MSQKKETGDFKQKKIADNFNIRLIFRKSEKTLITAVKDKIEEYRRKKAARGFSLTAFYLSVL
jgi:hypothetical protein